MDLQGARVHLRSVTEADIERLTEILADPDVARWWPGYDRARVAAENLTPDEGETHWAIELQGEVIGMVQSWEESDPEYRHATLDLFLDPAVRGQGLGPEVLRLVAGWLIDERGHHRLTIDPSVENASAIAAYRKVGFRDVGRLRQYQRLAAGWADALLMELLADELIR